MNRLAISGLSLNNRRLYDSPGPTVAGSKGSLRLFSQDSMALIVQKYGGTSVGNLERIENVAEKVIGWRERGHHVVVVVSAMSGETDR